MRQGAARAGWGMTTLRDAIPHASVFDKALCGLSVIALGMSLVSGAINTGHRLAEVIIGAALFFGGVGLCYEALKHHRANRVDARRRQQQCVSCGYEFRGSEDVCPECGSRLPPP